MTQGLLSFQYEREKNEKGLTALGGVGIYLDLLKALRLGRWLDREVGKSQGRQGYKDSEIGQALVLLNIIGGDCVEDLDVLERDEGFKGQYRKLVRKNRGMEKRFRRGAGRVIPSQSAVFRYLERFCDGEEGRVGEAVIPGSVGEMRGFLRCNGRVLEMWQQHMRERVATLDQDATMVETEKSAAMYGYKGWKSYQPLNVYWHEAELMVHTEFRPGNVPANHDLLRMLREGLAVLPGGIEEVNYRGDGASYQHAFMRYLDAEKGEDEIKKRFGKIRFAVSCPITEAYKSAVLNDSEIVWRPLDVYAEGESITGGREWAEVCYVPNELGMSKHGREYRYFMTRQLLQERALPGMEEQIELPFPVMEMGRKRYKVFGVVSNREQEGAEIIRWHDERCGKSEEAHAILKNDLAGGKMPSGKFGANAAWWWFAVLAFNIQSIMKRVALGKWWRNKRMKAVRFHLIHLPGRVIRRANKLLVRLSIGQDKLEWLLHVRQSIRELCRGSCVT